MFYSQSNLHSLICLWAGCQLQNGIAEPGFHSASSQLQQPRVPCSGVVQYKRLTRSNLYLFTRAALHFQRESQCWAHPRPHALHCSGASEHGPVQTPRGGCWGCPQPQRCPGDAGTTVGAALGHHLPCGWLSQFAHVESAGPARAGLPSLAMALPSLFLGFC